ncbi:MAG TPA: hypothetical protein VM487_22340 [Phycisphaerae bacterium]|nr:hypothetical protein [Phycisphaerae bacterium]
MGKQGIAILLVFGMSAAALADVTVYENEADFLAAIEGGGGYLLEDFDNLPPGSIDPPYVLGPENGYGGEVWDVGDGDPGLWGCTGALSTNSALNALYVDFASSPAPVFSSAGWFYASDYYCGFIPGYPMEITFTDVDDGSFGYSFVPANTTDFRGFLSTVELVDMTIEAPDSPDLAWPAMDHYYIDSPEPASLLLLGLGALLIRRR